MHSKSALSFCCWCYIKCIFHRSFLRACTLPHLHSTQMHVGRIPGCQCVRCPDSYQCGHYICSSNNRSLFFSTGMHPVNNEKQICTWEIPISMNFRAINRQLQKFCWGEMWMGWSYMTTLTPTGKIQHFITYVSRLLTSQNPTWNPVSTLIIMLQENLLVSTHSRNRYSVYEIRPEMNKIIHYDT